MSKPFEYEYETLPKGMKPGKLFKFQQIAMTALDNECEIEIDPLGVRSLIEDEVTNINGVRYPAAIIQDAENRRYFVHDADRSARARIEEEKKRHARDSANPLIHGQPPR